MKPQINSTAHLKLQRRIPQDTAERKGPQIAASINDRDNKDFFLDYRVENPIGFEENFTIIDHPCLRRLRRRNASKRKDSESTRKQNSGILAVIPDERPAIMKNRVAAP
jgi:hypothetical protein